MRGRAGEEELELGHEPECVRSSSAEAALRKPVGSMGVCIGVGQVSTMVMPVSALPGTSS